LQPAAEFLELGLSPSDSEKFLTPPIPNGSFPKGSNGALEKTTDEIFFNTCKQQKDQNQRKEPIFCFKDDEIVKSQISLSFRA
jgi:hypothetical protein